MKPATRQYAKGGNMILLFSKIYSWLNRHLESTIAKATPRWISPNMVTVFRALLAVPIIVLIFHQCTAAAITFFTIACMLDYVDGALARGRNEVTELGKFLDPIADKAFFVALALPTSIAIFVSSPSHVLATAALVLCAAASAGETALTAVRTRDFLYNRTNTAIKRDLKAPNAGKLKFVLQVTGLGALIVIYPEANHPLFWVSASALALSLPLAYLSLVHKQNQPTKSR